MDRSRAPVACVVVFALTTLSTAQDCQPGWDAGYPDGALYPNCFSLFVTGEGADQTVYAGTAGYDCCGGLYPGILRWDGHDWASVGGGVRSSFYGWDAEVRAMANFDDGTGPHLYIAGRFTDVGGNPARSVARLDGDTWGPLGGGLNGGNGEPGNVNALAVFDDGTGPVLYAAGRFISADGKPASNIARWNGQNWSPVGLGIGGEVLALEVYGEGDDARLYAAGTFTTADLMPASHIATWDGSSWSGVDGGTNETVHSLRVFDDGNGPMLIAGGSFSEAGDQAANAIAAWDGAHWSPLGNGLINGYDNTEGIVRALQVADLGAGTRLFVAGHFAKAGNAPAEGFAQWDGAQWAASLPGFADPNSGGTALAMAQADFGGPVLIMGGIMGNYPSPRSPTLWDGTTFRPLGPGATGAVEALLSSESDGGPVLYAAGDFWAIGGVHANHIAAWDADGWRPLDSGLDNDAVSLALFDDGGGEALYAAGIFENAGGVPASSVAKWDGQSWSAVANPSDGPNDFIRALAVYDDGNGEALYATGYFSSMGGQPVSNIARWDGTEWSSVGGGLTNVPYGSGGGHCLAAYDDGTGLALYVGGAFAMAGDTPVLNIARWNGSAWGPVGPGLKWLNHPQDQAYVLALTVFDEGDGPRLFAAGAFSRAADLLVRRIGRWDGQQWSPVGDGFDFTVNALCAFDDGGGPALFAAGSFNQAVGFGPVSGIARWRNDAWTPLGEGIHGWGESLATHTIREHPVLIVGGHFNLAGSHRSDNYAVFNACPSTCPADCDPSTGSGTLDLFDFFCFINAFNAANPKADCTEDETFDLFDFLCFVNAFNTGC